jgi:tRNA pseudouridine38-40 synthase
LIVAYDGTEYAGWQIQLRDPSVQQCLQEAWRGVTGESIAIIASGRTDSGVHALGQVCSVATGSSLSCAAIVRALNAHLPPDVRVLRVEEAPPGFHAIRDAIAKTYRYQIQFGSIPNALQRRHYWFVRGPLDIDAMRCAAETLIGRHDFASFQAVGAERVSTVRTIHCLELVQQTRDGYPELLVEISADGFLYNMVRIIVGSLVLVGRHKKPPSWLEVVRDARDRRMAGPTAPARGLVLVDVAYES